MFEDISNEWMKSCWDVPVTHYFATGAVIFYDSEVNFIGTVSFEGNHANTSGGKGKFQDALSAIRGA